MLDGDFERALQKSSSMHLFSLIFFTYTSSFAFYLYNSELGKAQ